MLPWIVVAFELVPLVTLIAATPFVTATELPFSRIAWIGAAALAALLQSEMSEWLSVTAPPRPATVRTCDSPKFERVGEGSAAIALFAAVAPAPDRSK